MYIVWAVVCGLMIITYFYLDGKVWFNLIKRNSDQTKSTLPGKRWHYIVAKSVIAFSIVGSAYFALIDFVRIQSVSLCWLGPAIVIAILSGLSASVTLRHATFSMDIQPTQSHNNRPQAVWWRGGFLGALAAGLASILFIAIYFFPSIVAQDFSEGYLIAFIIFYIVQWTVGLVVTFLVALLPGIMGGLTVMFIVKVLSESMLVTPVHGILIGIFVGGFWGYIAVQVGAAFLLNFVIDVYSVEEEVEVYREIIRSGLIVAIIAGAGCGWQIAKSKHTNPSV